MLNRLKLNKKKNKAQVTLFIILAILIVVVIIALVIFWPKPKLNIPTEFEPVYNYYLSCIEEEVRVGSVLLGQTGGYIESPEFSPGNTYLPFSSHLDFLGIGVPYWYYISGNNIVREQIPSVSKMEAQLNDFTKEGIDGCSFSEFTDSGFEIGIGPSEVETFIEDGKIDIEVDQEIQMRYGDSYWAASNHKTEISSPLKRYYDVAKKIYSYNKENMFLENYALDVLRLNAPVDGSEIGCSPKVWSLNEIQENLTVALENNIPAIKVKGDYYEDSHKYFVRDIGEDIEANVNFMYMRDWPMRLEAWPSEDGILSANPIGLQEGLGMLGFCYVPYHFVYDFGFPVLIQIYDDEMLFQFPVVVYIDKTVPRVAGDIQGLPQTVPELCDKKNTEMTIEVTDNNFNPVDADISYKCFDTVCSIGKTELNNGISTLVADFPQCVNGYIVADAPGYKKRKHLASIMNSGSEYVVMTKLYDLELELMESGASSENKYALITFENDDETLLVNYPEQTNVQLTSGDYDVKVYVYDDSSLTLQGSSEHKCVTVPKTGFAGFLGGEEEKCFTMDIPDQTIDYAVVGGGSQGHFIGESELIESKKIILEVDYFGAPSKVEDLQLNYNKVETSGLNIYFE